MPLLAVLQAARQVESPIAGALGTKLLEMVDRARAAHPAVRIPDATFVGAIVDRLGEEPAVVDLTALHAEDLFLACACGAGDRAALDEFEQRFLGAAFERAIARVTTSAALVAEAQQQLCVRLFVTDGTRPPKIHEYSGRGPLHAWVRTAAVRGALNLVSRGAPGDAGNEPVEPLLGVPDPETDYLKTHYRPEFEEAFRAALETLSAEQRLFLRFHYVDRLTMAQIAGLRRVHESTISRALLAAREQLLGETRRALGTKLRMGQDDVDSLMVQVMSRADITLSALFRAAP